MVSGVFHVFAFLCISAVLAVPVQRESAENYKLTASDNDVILMNHAAFTAVDDAERKIKEVIGGMFDETKEAVKDIAKRKDELISTIDEINVDTSKNLDDLKERIEDINDLGYGMIEHFKETFDVISQEVLKSVGQIVDVAINLGKKTLEKIFKQMKEIAADSTKLAGEAAKKLLETLTEAKGSLLADVQEIRGWIERDLKAAKEKIQASLQDSKIDAQQAGEEIRQIILDLIERVKIHLTDSLSNIKGTSGVLLRSVVSIADEASRDFRDDIKDQLLEEVKVKSQSALKKAKDSFEKQLNKGKDAAKELQEKLSEIAEKVKGKAAEVTEKVKKSLSKVVDGLKQTVKDASKKLGEIRETISNAFQKLGKKIADFFRRKYVANDEVRSKLE